MPESLYPCRVLVAGAVLASCLSAAAAGTGGEWWREVPLMGGDYPADLGKETERYKGCLRYHLAQFLPSTVDPVKDLISVAAGLCEAQNTSGLMASRLQVPANAKDVDKQARSLWEINRRTVETEAAAEVLRSRSGKGAR